MKKILTSIVAIILTITSLCPPQTVYGAEWNATAPQLSPAAAMSNDMSVEGTNSFGALFADMVEEKQEEQEENQGFNIFAAEISENQATVSFETLKDCTLVVAIYDEAGKKMLTSSSVEVKKGDTSAVVVLEKEAMPQYFYLRCFLVEMDTMRPLCTQYESPNYTKEMQEFFATTIHDFDSEKVLNLDEDETDNFAVFNDTTKIISHKDKINEIIQTDEENGIYVFDNVDESVTSLEKGDIFAYESAEGECLIVKVGSLKAEDKKVSITADDTSMEEVFQYVKVSGKSSVSQAKIDPSTCQQGTEYDELVKNEAGSLKTGEFALSFKFVDKELSSNKEETSSVKLNGSIKLAISSSVKLYVSLSYLYFELSMDYSLSGKLGLSGKTTPVDIPLATLGFSPVAGVYMEITPSFVIEGSAEISFSISLEGSVGFSVSSKEGVKNLTSTPKVKPELKGEATIFIGICFKPKVKVISEKVAEVSFEALLGGEVKAVLSEQSEISLGKSKKLPDEIHNCKKCLDGDIVVKVQVSVETKLFHSDKLKFSYSPKEKSIKIGDFYWSIDRGEFGFGSCPYIYWKVQFRVKDESKNPVENVKISTSPSGSGQFVILKDTDKIECVNELVTNSKGKAVGYLSNGEYKIFAENEERFGSKKVKVKDKAKRAVITVEKQGAKLQISNGTVAVIDNDGNLYMWGRNISGQVGDGTTNNVLKPKLIMDNVAFVDTDFTTRAITKDGELYIWGHNGYGQAGDGTTNNVLKPTLILKDVVSVSSNGDTAGAITKDGKLYMWGYNGGGQVGDGSTENVRKPKLILNKVSSIDMAGSVGAITKDGELYMWGENNYGQIGDGTTEAVLTPKRIPLPYNSKLVVSTKTEQEVKTVSVNSNDNIENTSMTPEDQIPETTDIQKIVTTGENGSATGLMPDTMYNYYIMKSKSKEQPFTTDNLLYIGQALSDASGNLHIDYEMKEEYENPETVVVGMAQLELSEGQVTVSDVVYREETQDIEPEVLYQGVPLIEEKDYEVSGDFTADEVGEYTIIIEGIGYYKGTVSKKYKVSMEEGVLTPSPMISEEPTLTITPTEEAAPTITQTGEATPTVTPTEVPVTLEPTKILSATPTPKLKTENKKLQKTYGDKKFSVAIKKENPLKYKSSNSSVATVNQKGIVTIKGCGKSDIAIVDGMTGHVYQNISLTVVPKKPSLSTVKTSKKKVLKIKWTKDKKADGFEIYYADNKKFSKKKLLLVSSKTTKKTVKNLKSGKRYYVKMRAYKKWNGSKIKGSWSKTVSVKVK